MAHTPGPWKLIWHGNERYPYPLSIYTEDDAMWVCRDGTVSTPDNARLIAAAPDLLDAIRSLLSFASVSEHLAHDVPNSIAKARAAIAKAERKS